MAARVWSNPCAWSSSASGSKAVPRLMIGANREESRRRPMTSPVCRRAEPGSLRCLLAGRGPRAGRVVPADGHLAGGQRGADWRSPSPTAATANSPGRTRRARRDCWPLTSWTTHRPEDAVRFARAELASGGFGGCNYLVAGRDPRPSSRRPARGGSASGRADARRSRHDQPGRRRSPTTGGSASSWSVSTRASSRPPRPASAATSGSSSPAPSGARSPSSLVSIGPEIVFDHIRGDPRGRDYERYRLTDEGRP